MGQPTAELSAIHAGHHHIRHHQVHRLRGLFHNLQCFGTVCGFCHVDGGRRRGKGPQLMGTKRSDEYMINRIATGKPGKMPAFGQSLTLEQIEAIVHYIRNLKPREVAAP